MLERCENTSHGVQIGGYYMRCWLLLGELLLIARLARKLSFQMRMLFWQKAWWKESIVFQVTTRTR